MSHYTGHYINDQVPRARVAFFGISLVAVGLLGFASYQQRKHKRLLALDKLTPDQARISSWEYRMLEHEEQAPSPTLWGVLGASSFKALTNPLSSPVMERDSRHGTVAEDAALLVGSSTNADESVYTKNPGWREQAHYAAGTGGKDSNAESMVDREAQKIAEVVENVEEKVKSLIGKGKSK